ncbi:MAG: two-component regulator propeller domain-containing protein, partial [Anaerolineales bacterium]
MLSILVSIHSFSQSSQLQFNFQPVKLKDSEISSKELMALLQDSRGFIWIGTKAGINVFDGYTYTVYKQNSKDSLSLGGDYIKSLMEDNLHRIIVNTNNTVDVFHPETGKFSHVSANMDGTIIPNSTFAVHALQSRDGTIYFTSEDELFIYDPETEIATELDVLKKEGFEARLSEYVNYTEDLHGTLWIPCRRKITGYNKESQKTYYIDLEDNPFFEGDQISSIYLQSPGKLGFFTNTHHYVYDVNAKILQEENCYNLPSSFTGYNQLIKIFQDNHNMVWFTNSLESTILLFDPAMMSFNDYPIFDETGRGFGQVRDILQDKQGIWWLATSHDGLYFSYPDNLNTFKHILSNTNNL